MPACGGGPRTRADLVPPHTKVPNADTECHDSATATALDMPPPSAHRRLRRPRPTPMPGTGSGPIQQGSEAINQCTGRKKWLTARLPILRPWSIPSSTAFRKWNPTRMRERPFSSLAWEKLV